MVFATDTEVDLGLLGAAFVTRLLGQGGQGYVYEVRRPSGNNLALKWYKPQSATVEQFRELQTLVDFGSPDDRFLWPLSLARIEEKPGFGYVMPLRDPRFLELNHLLAGVDPTGQPLDVSFSAVIAMCRHLSVSFLRLHARGLCYRDISFGNVLFEPDSGDILICDNDNVGVDNGTGRVLGTPFFMAPEVVRDVTYQTMPNTETDRHSLAVLLFYILCVGHPFEGQRTEQGLRDQSWLLAHFGTDPVFCMHPERGDNRPGDVVIQYWSLYPQFLRDLFVHAFVDAVDEPSLRVTEGQWIKAVDRLRDGMVRCGDCGETNFWDAAEPERTCNSCGGLLRPQFVLQIGRRTLAVSPFATVRSDHVIVGSGDSSVIGRVRQHPREAGRWGLHNASDRTWPAEMPGGHSFNVEPGQIVEISPGLTLRIDSAVLKIRVP